MKKRLQQNRPQLKIDLLDQNSEMSERDLKSPNLVIQPMARGKDGGDELETPMTLGYNRNTSMLTSGNNV